MCSKRMSILSCFGQFGSFDVFDRMRIRKKKCEIVMVERIREEMVSCWSEIFLFWTISLVIHTYQRLVRKKKMEYLSSMNVDQYSLKRLNWIYGMRFRWRIQFLWNIKLEKLEKCVAIAWYIELKSYLNFYLKSRVHLLYLQ